MDKIKEIIENVVKRHGYKIAQYKKDLCYPFYIQIKIEKVR